MTPIQAEIVNKVKAIIAQQGNTLESERTYPNSASVYMTVAEKGTNRAVCITVASDGKLTKAAV